MKKTFLFVFIMALLCMGRTARADYLRETDGTMYILGYMFKYSTCLCCEVTVTVSSMAFWTKGLLFIENDPYNNNKPLKITVFGNWQVYSWTLEGNWCGNGSHMTGIINTSTTNCTYYDTHLYFSSSDAFSAAMLPIPQSEFNPKAKHHYLCQRPAQARLGEALLRSKE